MTNVNRGCICELGENNGEDQPYFGWEERTLENKLKIIFEQMYVV
jgi:hypothetical protein